MPANNSTNLENHGNLTLPTDIRILNPLDDNMTVLILVVVVTIFTLTIFLCFVFVVLWYSRKCCGPRGKMTLPVIDLDEQERAETICRTSIDNGHATREDMSLALIQQAPAKLEDLPSPPAAGDVKVVGIDTIQRNSWSGRNSSFRLANDSKLRLVERVTKANTIGREGRNTSMSRSIPEDEELSLQESPSIISNHTYSEETDKLLASSPTADLDNLDLKESVELKRSKQQQNGKQRNSSVKSNTIDDEATADTQNLLSQKREDFKSSNTKRATVRPSNSIRQTSSYRSFREHMEQYGGRPMRLDGGIKVLPPVINGSS